MEPEELERVRRDSAVLKADVRERIERDIAAGRIREVRKRLHRLVRDHPEDLSLRRALGDVYARLGDTIRAGKFWYLVEDKTDDMLDACRQFKRSCRRRPVTIAKRLRYEGDLEAAACGQARRILRALVRKRKADEELARIVARAFGCLLLVLMFLGLVAFILFIIVMSRLPLMT